MRSLRTVERSYGTVQTLLAPLLAVTVGGAALVGGCAKSDEPVSHHQEPSRAAPTTTVAAARTAIRNTVTGRIETLRGEPLQVRSDPFGPGIGEYRDGSSVEIICQAPGPNAPGDPADFGKPPLADTTWYRLGDPATGAPFDPERWIPQNPVFTTDPIPSCPQPLPAPSTWAPQGG